MKSDARKSALTSGRGDVAGRLIEALTVPCGLFEGAERAGERIGVLTADLRSGPLSAATVVSAAGAG